MTITKVVYNFLDNLEDDTIISGWELFSKINAITGKKTYPSTLLKMCRNYCQIVGGDFICIDRQNSTYKYKKGFVIIGNSNISGKE